MNSNALWNWFSSADDLEKKILQIIPQIEALTSATVPLGVDFSRPIAILREKRVFLEEELAKAVEPDARFAINCRIRECDGKIAELRAKM